MASVETKKRELESTHYGSLQEALIRELTNAHIDLLTSAVECVDWRFASVSTQGCQVVFDSNHAVVFLPNLHSFKSRLVSMIEYRVSKNRWS